MLRCHSSTQPPLAGLSIDSVKVRIQYVLYSSGLRYCPRRLPCFSSLVDIYAVDEQLMDTLRAYLQTLFAVISTIAVISAVTPIFMLCLVPMLVYYVKEQSFFTVSGIAPTFPVKISTSQPFIRSGRYHTAS
jgi:hypothetical protein